MKKLSLHHNPHSAMRALGKFFAILWVVCILGVIATIAYVVGVRKELFTSAPAIYVQFLLVLVGIGCLSFGIALLSFFGHLFMEKTDKKQNILLLFIKLFLIATILPIYLIIRLIGSRIVKVKRIGLKNAKKTFRLNAILNLIVPLAFVSVVLLPIWGGGYFVLGSIVYNALGYSAEDIAISGTGSMYPTFPKGEGKDPKALAKQIVGTPGMIRYPNGLVIAGKRYFGYRLHRGDIVSIQNNAIKEMTQKMYGEPGGWIKRIIGLGGDSIELRNGIVYLNGTPLAEPYTAKPHSTFGETFLGECKKVIVPQGDIFVMGDNRKGSGDSREIGFIKASAVNHVLPLEKQKGALEKTWRDTSHDFDNSSFITLDKNKYLALLNEKRKEAGVQELKYQPKLEKSAGLRGETILKHDDFSFEATKSGYTMSRAMSDAGYYNTTWGEAPTQGYYDAEELLDNQFQFPESKKFLLTKAYQEIGISEVKGEINGCPTQVIVQHFAGYVPPNYKKEDIESWKTTLSQLHEIQPGWNSLKNNENFYRNNKEDVDRINEIISQRISSITAIVFRMEANQWLTSSEQNAANQDKALFDEQESIAKRLNSR